MSNFVEGQDPENGKFLPGNKLGKGRVKGSRNALTEQMLKRFAQRNQDGISVEEILFDIAQDSGQPAEMRFKAAAKLSDLVFPKASSVELDIEEKTEMSITDMDDRIRQLMRKHNPHFESGEDGETD
ncbi:hypothetical protein PQC39_gp104 [Vibrio phage Vp_R1]|uniref:DUF5681 domain-containing protein n=1 Tax=Vibrio phage Vp_R1 TaxID=2059867 RepID=A0A2H5BQ60_9CAUD|nr:hypothetical protein PQC39_gp104 [Vibrio phage Vp_R1]AUG88468.1 hypothetical protein VPR_104 [Vibrio phage Vp_R1]